MDCNRTWKIQIKLTSPLSRRKLKTTDDCSDNNSDFLQRWDQNHAIPVNENPLYKKFRKHCYNRFGEMFDKQMNLM